MALAITHAKVSAKPDGADASLVQASDWNATHVLTGVASVAQGGTGLGTLTAHGVLVGAGTGNVAVTAAGTAGQVLTSNGASADPTFQAFPIGDPVTPAHGGTGLATLTAHGVLIGEGTSNVAVTTAGTAGQLLTSGGASADPSFQTPTIAVTLTDGASVPLDASGTPAWLTGKYYLAAAGDRSIAAPTNATDGQKIIIVHYASGGARTLSLTTGSAGAFRFGSDITALTQTASGKKDYIGAVYNGTDSRWDVVAYIKGF